MKSSPVIWHLQHNVKSTVKNLSIFMAFLESLNFTNFLFLKTHFSFITWVNKKCASLGKKEDSIKALEPAVYHVEK